MARKRCFAGLADSLLLLKTYLGFMCWHLWLHTFAVQNSKKYPSHWTIPSITHLEIPKKLGLHWDRVTPGLTKSVPSHVPSHTGWFPPTHLQWFTVRRHRCPGEIGEVSMGEGQEKVARVSWRCGSINRDIMGMLWDIYWIYNQPFL